MSCLLTVTSMPGASLLPSAEWAGHAHLIGAWREMEGAQEWGVHKAVPTCQVQLSIQEG